MRKLVLAAVVLACILLLLPAVARAASDDDIPGVQIALGQTVGGVVDDSTDAYDVWSIALVSGEQVRLQASDADGNGHVHVTLIAPGATSIHSRYDELASLTADNGSSQFEYTPAKDGVYYILVAGVGKGRVYSLILGGSAQKPPYPSLLRLRCSATKVRRGGRVTLSATLVTSSGDLIGGRTVQLRQSSDGKSWATAQTLSSPSGSYSARVAVTGKTWF